jgi:hypothetical protein
LPQETDRARRGRRGGWGDRLRRAVRRHRPAFMTAAAFAIAGLLGFLAAGSGP